jgi:hypothetical protein
MGFLLLRLSWLGGGLTENWMDKANDLVLIQVSVAFTVGDHVPKLFAFAFKDASA